MQNSVPSKALMALAKSTLVFVVLICSITVSGQPYFSKIYPGLPLVRATITPDSGLVVCGGGGSAVYANTAGRILMRVDRSGVPLWSNAYNPTLQEAIWIHDVAWIGDSSFIIVGNSGTNFTTNNKMVQEVIGPNGMVIWGGRLNGEYMEDTYFALFGAQRCIDGSVVVCGTRVYMTLSSTYGYGYATRVSSHLGLYLTPLVLYGSGGSGEVVELIDVAATADGGFVSLGFNNTKAVVYKVDVFGSVAWSRYLNIINGDQGYMRLHVKEGDTGYTYIAQEAWGDFFRFIQLDPDGNVVWCKRFEMPGEDIPTGMERLPNGDVWISGTDWLMACSSNGEVLWARSIPYRILDMEAVPGGDGVFLVGRDGSDGWIMRTDVNGQVPGCAETSFVPTITLESLVASPYVSPVPANGMTTYLASAIPVGVPTVTVDCIPTAVQGEPAVDAVFRAYPVPFSDQLNIDLPGPDLRLELIDAQGKVQWSQQTTTETTMNMKRGDLHSGFYLLRVSRGLSHIAMQPVVVE